MGADGNIRAPRRGLVAYQAARPAALALGVSGGGWRFLAVDVGSVDVHVDLGHLEVAFGVDIGLAAQEEEPSDGERSHHEQGQQDLPSTATSAFFSVSLSHLVPPGYA